MLDVFLLWVLWGLLCCACLSDFVVRRLFSFSFRSCAGGRLGGGK